MPGNVGLISPQGVSNPPPFPLIVFAMGCWPVLRHSSMLDTLFGHRIPRICRWDPFVQTCSLWSMAMVYRQVSELYSRTVFTFEFKILSFVFMCIHLLFQMGLSMANASRAYVVLAWMSSSVPPVVLTRLPRYVNLVTSSITCLSSSSGACMVSSVDSQTLGFLYINLQTHRLCCCS